MASKSGSIIRRGNSTVALHSNPRARIQRDRTRASATAATSKIDAKEREFIARIYAMHEKAVAAVASNSKPSVKKTTAVPPLPIEPQNTPCAVNAHWCAARGDIAHGTPVAFQDDGSVAPCSLDQHADGITVRESDVLWVCGERQEQSVAVVFARGAVLPVRVEQEEHRVVGKVLYAHVRVVKLLEMPLVQALFA